MATTSPAHLLTDGNAPAAFGTGSCHPGGVLLPALTVGKSFSCPTRHRSWKCNQSRGAFTSKTESGLVITACFVTVLT